MNPGKRQKDIAAIHPAAGQTIPDPITPVGIDGRLQPQQNKERTQR